MPENRSDEELARRRGRHGRGRRGSRNTQDTRDESKQQSPDILGTLRRLVFGGGPMSGTVNGQPASYGGPDIVFSPGNIGGLLERAVGPAMDIARGFARYVPQERLALPGGQQHPLDAMLQRAQGQPALPPGQARPTFQDTQSIPPGQIDRLGQAPSGRIVNAAMERFNQIRNRQIGVPRSDLRNGLQSMFGNTVHADELRNGPLDNMQSAEDDPGTYLTEQGPPQGTPGLAQGMSDLNTSDMPRWTQGRENIELPRPWEQHTPTTNLQNLKSAAQVAKTTLGSRMNLLKDMSDKEFNYIRSNGLGMHDIGIIARRYGVDPMHLLNYLRQDALGYLDTAKERMNKEPAIVEARKAVLTRMLKDYIKRNPSKE